MNADTEPPDSRGRGFCAPQSLRIEIAGVADLRVVNRNPHPLASASLSSRHTLSSTFRYPLYTLTTISARGQTLILGRAPSNRAHPQTAVWNRAGESDSRARDPGSWDRVFSRILWEKCGVFEVGAALAGLNAGELSRTHSGDCPGETAVSSRFLLQVTARFFLLTKTCWLISLTRHDALWTLPRLLRWKCTDHGLKRSQGRHIFASSMNPLGWKL